MSAKKTGRKKRSEYRKFKKHVRALKAMQSCIHIVSMTVEAAQMNRAHNKCMSCFHTYKEQKGGIVANINTDNVSLIQNGPETILSIEQIKDMTKGIK